MYDLNKRSYFTTLGELRALLADLPDDTEVCTGGVLGSYLHFEKDKDLISFDDEDLDSDYSDEYPDYYDENELYLVQQEREDNEHGKRIEMIEEGQQFLLVGNKLMRTFLADDGSWDYELYDINLTVKDSGQLGENKNMTRKEAIETVLSWNNLIHEERHTIIPTKSTSEKI